MELNFPNTVESIDRLDEIMNSYPGRNRGTIIADRHSLVVMLALLMHGNITVTEHSYTFDPDIQKDNRAMEVYTELARETRWKQSEYTEIERIRINDLRQMSCLGKPFYDGEFVCWQEGRACAHCGNLTLSQLLMYLASHEMVRQFYIFTSPCWTEEWQAKYYRFDLSETAIKGATVYRKSVWDKIRTASEASDIYRTIYPLEDEPPSMS